MAAFDYRFRVDVVYPPGFGGRPRTMDRYRCVDADWEGSALVLTGAVDAYGNPNDPATMIILPLAWPAVVSVWEVAA